MYAMTSLTSHDDHRQHTAKFDLYRTLLWGMREEFILQYIAGGLVVSVEMSR